MEQITDSIAVAALPGTPSESTTAVVHYYRAEMGRMNSWRDRLDTTSNWAITVTAALLSVSLSTATAHHGVLLFAMVLVGLLLCVEARRYRFYDVYRMRVRQFERHYFAPMFSGSGERGPEPWLSMLAQDLRHPRFRLSFGVAIRRRLKRNYIWMYLILLAAWILKIASPQLQDGAHLDPGRPLDVALANATLGALPGLAVIIVVAGFYAALCFSALRSSGRNGDQVHV